jgi:4-diphosphocytidyl-2-C-methyl-D-erythritol kinase
MPIEVFAPAKVNLTLHVTGQREDGYHLLDSLIAFAPFGDLVRMSPADAFDLRVTGVEGAGVPDDARNLAAKSIALHARACGGKGAFEVELVKQLPAASGIGGGSSDAAAALRGAIALSDAEVVDYTEGRMTLRGAGGSMVLDLLALGADLPMCYDPVPARVRGIGERLDRVALPSLPAVLVNPRVEVATPKVFRALESKNNPASPENLPEWADTAALIAWLGTQRNDLQPPAVLLEPAIGEVLTVLQESADLARMSGSGATCFGLYQTAELAQRAAVAIARAHPEWWVRHGVLGDQSKKAAATSVE